MRLISLIGLRLTIALSVITALWAGFFYIAMVDEVNDETDDMLEAYSEDIITRFLAGQPLPTESEHTNNEYYLYPLTLAEAEAMPHIAYADSMVYVRSKGETEPARILTHIFQSADGQYHRVVVSTPTFEKQDLILSISFWILILMVSLIATVLGVSLWIYDQTNKPLHRLLRWLDAYRLGDTNRPLVNDTKIIEYRKLNEAVLDNAHRAEELFADQKLFIGNVSHELQTPIAIIRHRLEGVMESDNLTDEQAQQLSLAYERLEYMTRLNRSLLLMSRIDNQQFNDRQPLSLAELIEGIVPDYQEAYQHASLTVGLHLDHGAIHTMDKTLAGILLHNLIKNAFAHTPHHGHIEVRLDKTSLEVLNTSDGHALDRQHIFDRFYQGHKRREGSTGLGLALVVSICRVERLAIDYSFTPEGRHCFRIVFAG